MLPDRSLLIRQKLAENAKITTVDAFRFLGKTPTRVKIGQFYEFFLNKGGNAKLGIFIMRHFGLFSNNVA